MTGLLPPVQNHFQFTRPLAIRNATSVTFQVCPGPQQTSYFLSNSHQHVQRAQGELCCSTVIFLHSLRILVWRFHVHRFCKLRVWGGGILSKPHNRMIDQYQHISTMIMIQLVHLNTVIIRLYRLCGCLLSVGLSTIIFTTSYLMNNLGISWYHMLGFLVVGAVQTGARIGNSVLLPEDMDYFHQLPHMRSEMMVRLG